MSTAIIVALISGCISLAAALIAVVNARTVARLNSELEERRRERTKREQAEELRARYRDPLLGAAFDLQSRLYNIVAKEFLVRYTGDEDRSSAYAVDNTLHVLAEYLGWVEIIRRDIQFLNLGQEVADRRWVAALEQVREVLARDDLEPVLRLFRGEQRAIGELMTISLEHAGGARPRECLGYAGFVKRLAEPEFAAWFENLRGDLELLAREPKLHLVRPVLLQNALVEVLDVLDPEQHRFGAERRTRLAVTTPSPSTEAQSTERDL